MSEEFAEKATPPISEAEPKISKKGWGGPRPNSGGKRPGAGRKKKVEIIATQTKSGRVGGYRPGSGRKPGTPNIMTRELKELCRHEAPILVEELIRLSKHAESEAVRVAAIKELLDRGWGRPTQPIEGNVTYGVSEQLAELFRENASGTLGTEIARRVLPAPNGEHEQELH